MKIFYSAIFILAAVLVSVIGLQTNVRVEGKTDVSQDLQNEKAIEYLKQTNSYDSLAEAVKTANLEGAPESDLFFVQRQRLTADDGAMADRLGGSVAISGDTAVVGANGYQSLRGAAYVFVRSGNVWTQQAKLTANDGAIGDNFGFSVAISGDTIIIGAFGDDIGSNPEQGSAYIFVRSGTTWTAQDKLTANDGAMDDDFGYSVGISGDTVIIGSLYSNIGTNSNQGAAYVFVRSGGAWTLQQKLTATLGTVGANFGFSVALASGTAIVGAANETISGQTGQGAAYVFVRSGTMWNQQTRLTASDGSAADFFGCSVDLSLTAGGAIAVVGAYGDDIAGNLRQGSAYVFNRSQLGTWSQTQKITAADGVANLYFGASVSIAPTTGSTVIVGAFHPGSGGRRDSAYIYQRVDSVWTQQQKLMAYDGSSGDDFGFSVAVSGDIAMVGAPLKTIGVNSEQGAAYVFNVGAPIPFDFDGDGKTDVSVFRPSDGRWWISRSSSSTFVATFGLSSDRIMPADFTGDDKTDIALFRPSSGSWFVLRSESFTFYSFPFGASTDTPTVGDFDGDGKADAAVFRPSNATWYISKSSGGTTIQQFGAATDVPVPADYDGDGKTDIAIFRPNGTNGAEWWRQNSSNSTVLAFQFGLSSDKPVPGDYTGDGKTDVAIWRPSNGNWFILRSEDASFYAFPFGANGDIPAAGDYDGDGRWDAAVFRPSNSTWYLNRSTAGTLAQGFGTSTDKPVPSAFVP